MVVAFTSRVIERRNLTKDVVLFSLACPDTFTFKPGQFVSLKIKNNDVTRPRSYSILNPPSIRGRLELCIKIVEGGFASEIFSGVQVGYEFEVRGPFGHFVFDEESSLQEQVFIGTGTGVAPFYSMLFEYVPKMAQTKFTLLFGVRSKEGLFLHEDFERLALEHSNFTYVPTLSREEWQGKMGRVQAHIGEEVFGRVFYICGLKEMVGETKQLLEAKGVLAANIHVERYN